MTTRKQYLKWSIKPNFKRDKWFNNEAIAIEKQNVHLILSNQFILGQAN